MRCVDILSVCVLALAIPAHMAPLPNENNGGLKEKFKEFLRKAVYGLTPTTEYTTKFWRFPEEYDPVRVLEWQLREEAKVGLTTPDFEPILTEKTNLWDGYWNDPTIDDVTFWCMRHLHANDSMQTTVKRYWESEFDNGGSIEAIAKYWYKEAKKENEEWYRTYPTTKFVKLEDMTLDSEDGWTCSPKWDSHIDSEDARLMEEAQKIKDEEHFRDHAKYDFNYSPRTNQEVEMTTSKRTRVTEAPPEPTTEEPDHYTKAPHHHKKAPEEDNTPETTKRPRVPLIPNVPGLLPESESEHVSMDEKPREPL